MPDLLEPGSHRAAGLVSDAGLVAAMTRVELAWLQALAVVGAVEPECADDLAKALAAESPDLATLAADAESAGNPVVPLVRWLRAIVPARTAAVVHRGLTSQDVLDTALVLLTRDALARVRADLAATATVLGRLADAHRHSVMAGRTLTQPAVPITFGLKAARWLAGILDAREQVDAVLAALPVQCGGAAGTLALVAESTDPLAAAGAFADELMLRCPDLPWHTSRTPVTRAADTIVGALDALGVLANDVTLLARPEIGELREGRVAGRGGSSTMPHKQNPVLAVLVRSAALQAPLLGAQLHTCAAGYVDERPDGAWHAEWPALARLLTLSVTAASQAAELVAGLEVDAGAMRRRADEWADDLLAERGDGDGDLTSYLGAADAFIDVVLGRLRGKAQRCTPQEDFR